ncbi:MAG: TOBE domain-containing protein [Gemmatimonadaceae bacterium]
MNGPELPRATLAVRPEHLRIGPTDGAVKGTVTLVESLGPETLVHVQLDGGETAVARAPGAHTLPMGAVVPVSVDPSRVLLYDESGALVWRGS